MAVKRNIRHVLLWLLPAVLLAAAIFAAGFFSGQRSAQRAPLPWSESLCTVSYYIEGELYQSEQVRPGRVPVGVGYPEADGRRVIGWLDGNGREVDVGELTVYSDIRYTAVTAPLLEGRCGYFPHTEVLFRPESPLTRAEAAELFGSLLARPLPAEAVLVDMEEDGDAAEYASMLVTAGLMEAPEGRFCPRQTWNERDFAALLSRFFPSGDVERAMGLIEGLGDSSVSRAEAAAALDVLLGLSELEPDSYLPDIQPGYWAEQAVLRAAQGCPERREEGFCNIDGYLYAIDEAGYVRKNTFIGSLYFDQNGRYSSGDEELDDYVAAAIREYTTPDMTREEMLRALYVHVRDDFSYLRRSQYSMGDTGWARTEALTMYATGRGNCYNYASAFWAAARGLGYDASTVSGTMGSEHSPHGWVLISQDGGHYVYDVEIEMAYLRDGKREPDHYKMEHDFAVGRWIYGELYRYNQALPRQRELGQSPQ